MNMVEYDSEHSDDEGDIYAAEFVWPSKAKPFTCNDLKPIHKNRDEEMKFTFNIAKCDRTFDAFCCKRRLLEYLILYRHLKS